jgi:hypothetical protein
VLTPGWERTRRKDPMKWRRKKRKTWRQMRAFGSDDARG